MRTVKNRDRREKNRPEAQAQAATARSAGKTYDSDVVAAIHEMATDLHKAGVMKTATLRQFDDACLTPISELKPEEILQIRERSGVSQAVMARVVNVSTSTVGQWERGEKRPAGASLKLLTLAKERVFDRLLPATEKPRRVPQH
jgi:putative transcriptional regulator